MRQCRVIPEYLARLIRLRGTIAFESARMVTKTVPGTNASRIYEETFADRVTMFLEKVSEGAKFDVARIKKGIR